MSSNIKKELIKAQCSEITEYHIYKRLAKSSKGKHNKKVLNQIAEDELKHCGIWKKHTGHNPKPNKRKIWWYYLMSRIFGLTFGVKLMEKGERKAQVNYNKLSSKYPEAKQIIKDEEKHEQALIALLEEKKLSYIGSVVLGLNDALVELTGALAGFTFALQNTQLIAVVGLITGFAASLSMGASEYLSKKTEENEKHPFTASLYTGFAYFVTVLFLVFPYFILTNVYGALSWTILNAIVVIFLFTFYVSIAKNVSFKKKFWEMTFISLGIACISFLIGYLIKTYMGVNL
jgi:vacuolar iron transporter family protein